MQPSPTKPPRRPAKKRELAEWIARNRPERIGETEWDELLRLLAPVSESYLRHLLRDSGVPLAPLVEGVRQESLDTLEASLLRLLVEYEATAEPSRRTQVRKAVIEAKDHAKLSINSRKTEKAEEKREMILWMLTWLENPPVFRQWIALRRAALPLPRGRGSVSGGADK